MLVCEEQLKQTVERAAWTYRWLPVFGIASFILGALCPLVIALVGLFDTSVPYRPWWLIVGGFGTANLVAVMLYRPTARMQTAVDALIKAQIVYRSFDAQYKHLSDMLNEVSKQDLPYADTVELGLRLADHLGNAATRATADLAKQPQYIVTTGQTAQPRNQAVDRERAERS